MRLTNQLPPGTPPSPLLTPNRIQLITTENKNSYLEHWEKETKTQNKLDCYRGLNRKYEMAEYLYTVKDIKQRYRMSDHTLAIEKGRHKKTWLPKEYRICGHCTSGEIETEKHFLLKCYKYESIRDQYLEKCNQLIENYTELDINEKLRISLGEGPTASLAARYVSKCHNLRDSESTLYDC